MPHPPTSIPQPMPHRKLIQSPTNSPPVHSNVQPQLSQNKTEQTVSTVNTSHVTVATNSKPVQGQVQQDNEQFALAWLRATFEPVPTMATRIEQQDMYKMYLTASSKVGRVGLSSPSHFPRCVRSVFGASVGPNVPKGAAQSESPTLFYEGIRIRAKPLAIVYKGTILVSLIEIVRLYIKR